MSDCDLKGPNCTKVATKSYNNCAYCCTELSPVVNACAKCYFELYQKFSLICQKPACAVHTEEVKKQRIAIKKAEKEQAALEQEVAAREQMLVARTKLEPSLLEGLGQVETEFKNSPSATMACSNIKQINNKDVKTLVAAAKAAKWTAENIPGANAEQMFEIFYFAFSRGSTVALGGSRVRACHVALSDAPYTEGEVPYKPSSDLDVGYGSLDPGQARACNDGASKSTPGWLPIEDALIIPGNTIGGQRIASPEEFFQRSGERSPEDHKRKVDGIIRYYPSGSVSFALDGTPTLRPPGK